MAGFAQSPKNNQTIVIKVKDKKKFIEDVNNSRPSKEFIEKCEKAGKLVGIKE